MNNKIIFGQYYEADSFIHKLDPRVKIIGLLTLFISLFIINNLYVLLGLTSLLLILILCTKTPINKFFKSIKMMSFIILFTFILQILTESESKVLVSLDFNLTIMNLCIIVGVLVLWIFVSKYIKVLKMTIFIILLVSLFVLQYFVNFSPIITMYTINVTEDGLVNALFFTIRFMDFLFISSLLTLTTKPTQINNGLDKLLKPLSKIGLNTGAFAMIISVTLRFIPTLIEEASKILKAQASRGADLDDGNLMNKVGQMVSLVFPLFIVTYKKSADLTYAMEARGYVDRKERSSIYELKYKASDYISYSLLLIILVLSIVSVIIL